MKMIILVRCFFVLAIAIVFVSCRKNHTVFVEDNDAKNLSVFSDRGNNVMSCYINGSPFRTQDRITGILFGRSDYDINLRKNNLATDNDTLIVSWFADGQSYEHYSIELILSVKKGFSYTDFNLLEGKRLAIDGVNGYFVLDHKSGEKGTGSIYFHRAFLISNDSTEISRFSGIFEAMLPSYRITKGRFDHTLPGGVVFF
ncbi:hypothetical protein [Agriterribacter sp.]|uniref:hypothetical protein n=1 Tax=Agriterribacter sp. TaxID=2821509 RepID=UPI002BE7F6BF|nr:hypothetical protein [Agriterribacter sp.]HRP55287.1 hypothetical protein [Agriterribacter sp.]